MKIITHVDPSQLRLGYLCCLSLVAGRQLDTRQGLVDRLNRFVFQTIDSNDPRWEGFMRSVDMDELRRMKAPVDQKLAELHELFRIRNSDAPAYQLQALWLADRDLPSHVGVLAAKNAVSILEMGRSFEILTTGYALSEKGVFLQNFLTSTIPGAANGDPAGNPFVIGKRAALKLFFLYALLSVDILTPYLIDEFAKSEHGDPSNAPRLLPVAAQCLEAVIEDVTDISNVEALRACRSYATRLKTKGVAKNQAQPRYHHLFELGLLDRVEREDRGRRVVPYVATEAGKRAAKVWAPLRTSLESQQETIDINFFRWAAEAYGLEAQKCESDLRRLYYFARGFRYLEREIGFTPGRTVAIAGCLLALEDGWVIEVAEMFSTMRHMAAGKWRRFLEYSGGSRLDQEFLIKVKPEILSALETELQQPTSAHSQ